MASQRENGKEKGLPSRWRWKNGAYRYRVPVGDRRLWGGKSEYRLGSTLSEAYRVWAEQLEKIGLHGRRQTMADLFDEYASRIIPQKKASTARGQPAIIKRLNSVFGEMLPEDIKPAHAYQYFDRRTAKTAAKRELELLSHVLSVAVQWGRIDKNPLLGQLRLSTGSAPQQYVTDDQVIGLLRLDAAPKSGVAVVQSYVRLKLLTGLRRTDLLRLSVSDIQGDGLHVTTSKTGRAVVYELTPDLSAALSECKANRPALSPWLFCTRKGEPYIKPDATANGWESLWQRVMAKLQEQGGERFPERALRNKAGSDAESLEHASALLAHADASTTKRFYRVKPEVVKPLGERFK